MDKTVWAMHCTRKHQWWSSHSYQKLNTRWWYNANLRLWGVSFYRLTLWIFHTSYADQCQLNGSPITYNINAPLTFHVSKFTATITTALCHQYIYIYIYIEPPIQKRHLTPFISDLKKVPRYGKGYGPLIPWLDQVVYVHVAYLQTHVYNRDTGE